MIREVSAEEKLPEDIQKMHAHPGQNGPPVVGESGQSSLCHSHAASAETRAGGAAWFLS